MARYAVVIYKHLEKDRSQYQFDRTRFANNCLWHTLHGFLEGSTGDPETAKNPYLAHSALRVTFSFLAATASVGFFALRNEQRTSRERRVGQGPGTQKNDFIPKVACKQQSDPAERSLKRRSRRARGYASRASALTS